MLDEFAFDCSCGSKGVFGGLFAQPGVNVSPKYFVQPSVVLLYGRCILDLLKEPILLGIRGERQVSPNLLPPR